MVLLETEMSSTGNEDQPLLYNCPSTTWSDQPSNGHLPNHTAVHENYRNGLNRREKNGDLHSVHINLDGAIPIPLPQPERTESKFPEEKMKTLVSFMFLSASLIINVTSLAVVHERIPDRTKYPPLPDVFFDLFPPLDWALDVSEIIIILSIWFTLILVFLHKHRFIILRRVFFIMGLLYLMRSLTMFVTQVPVASTTYYCSPKANVTNAAVILKRVVQLIGGFGLSINGKHTFCGDYIYSGHTVILTLAYMVVKEYLPQRYKWVHWPLFFTSTTGVIMVLLSRGHYTVDVLIGYYVTSRLFWIYHSLANNPALKNRGPQNFLCRVWWFPFFSYFEKNVGGVVPDHYEWPPWPRRWWLPRTRIS